MKRPAPSKDIPQETDLTQVRVELRKVLGVRPAVYLTALYAVAAAVLVFFLLFYPGLRSHGTYITFVTRPAGAAIHVDGVYRGFTPAEVLVSSGSRKLSLSMPGLTPYTVERMVKGRVFATLLFKPRDRVEHDLATPSAAALARTRLMDYVTYAHEKGGGLLRETARVLTAPAVRDLDGADAALSGTLETAAAFLAPPAGDLSDYLEAWAIHASRGGVLGPGALARMVRELAGMVTRRDYLLAWALYNAGPELAQHAVQQPWIPAALSRLAVSGQPVASPAAGAAITASGVELRLVPGAQAVIGDETAAAGRPALGPQPAHIVTIEPFYMSTTEITGRQYANFLAEVPTWRKANLRRLMEQGLAADEYLADWDADVPPAGKENHPVTQVPHAAARAFAKWLQGKLPAGYTVRLPFEAEWEWAARGGGRMPADPPFRSTAGGGTVASGSTAANGYGLREMMGNVWEWCEDWYAPSAYYLSSADIGANRAESTQDIPLGTERVVRGGAWANESRQVPVYARGSQPPEWTTPYLGFRVVATRASP